MATALFIGRFQPFHNGHLDAIRQIFAKPENKKILIMIGSSNAPASPQNPFSSEERRQLIEAALKEAEIPQESYEIFAVPDINDPPNWVTHINKYLPAYQKVYTGSPFTRHCFEIAKTKEKPQILPLAIRHPISATQIREAILQNKPLSPFLPKAVENLLKAWEIEKRLKTLTSSS